MNSNKETLVVIPYLAKEAQGCELELAVAGWHKHFKEPHRIVVVGDRDEQVEKLLACPEGKSEGSITFIDCPQIEPVEGQYLPHLDQMNKFYVVARAFPELNGFVYSNDDIYAVRDFTLGDIKQPKVNALEIPDIDEKETRWWGDMGKSRRHCLLQGFPIMDWACHLPVYFNFDCLFACIPDDYIIRRTSYEWQNIYFNYMNYLFGDHVCGNYYRDPVIVPERGSIWKYAVNRAHPGIKAAEEAKAIWITNSNSGWSAELEGLLRKHYEM